MTNTYFGSSGSGTMQYLGVAILAVIWCINSFAANAAQITHTDFDGRNISTREIIFEGEIQVGDAIALSKLFDRSRVILSVTFLSPGGDVDEALAISKLLNEYFVAVKTPDSFPPLPGCDDEHTDDKNCVCYSACAVIWLSAVRRDDGTNVGVHRPFFNESYFAGLTAKEAETVYSTKLEEVTEYLDAAEVPRTIIEKMMATSSSEVYILSEAEKALMPSIRPFLAELINARCAVFAESRDEEIQLRAAIQKGLVDAEKGDKRRAEGIASSLVAGVRLQKLLETSPYHRCSLSETYNILTEKQGVNP